MPRNGSGTYALPAGNPVVTGTAISSTVHNNTMNDIAAEITNSTDKDGQTVITGTWDFNANKIVLDTDADTSITADTDNIIDFELEGVDAVRFGWQSVADTGFITSDPKAFTADTTENTHRLVIASSNAVTIPSGTTALVSTAYFDEPNITATGTVTAAATVYIKAAPTEGSSNYALWVDSGDSLFEGSISSTVSGTDVGLTISNTGTGNGIFVNSDADAISLNIDSEASTVTPIRLTSQSNDYMIRANNERATGQIGIIVDYTGGAPNSTSSQFLQCNDTGALRAQIRSNGGLANFSANNVNLSDERLKKDIVPASSLWEEIKGIEVVNFLYKDQEGSIPNLGVIAQQVEEVASRFVSHDGFGDMGEKEIPEEEAIMDELIMTTKEVKDARYELDPKTGKAVSVTTKKEVRSPTKKTRKVLKEGVRLDQETGKFYQKLTKDNADAVVYKTIFETDLKYGMLKALQEAMIKIEELQVKLEGEK